MTTHKVNLLAAARDMFDYLDPYAVACAEVSSISKNEALLAGHAKDPVTGGLTLDTLLGGGYFGRTGGHVLSFGAGGATTALALHLARKPDRADRPRRMIVVNRSPGRLDFLRQMVAGLRTDIEFEYHCNVLPKFNDELMSKLPPASLVINATGMGKDLPGDGEIILIARMLGLLRLFLGEALTLSLLRNAWPGEVFDDRKSVHGRKA